MQSFILHMEDTSRFSLSQMVLFQGQTWSQISKVGTILSFTWVKPGRISTLLLSKILSATRVSSHGLAMVSKM